MLPVFAFELRQQLRSHVFWIVFAISGLMVAGALWIPELRVGLSATGSVDGVGAILRTHLVWTLFYLFTAAALSADAVLRDDLTGFAPIIRSAPIRRRDYLLGGSSAPSPRRSSASSASRRQWSLQACRSGLLVRAVRWHTSMPFSSLRFPIFSRAPHCSSFLP